MVAGIAGLFLRHQVVGHHWWSIAVQVAAVALMIAARIAFGMRSFHAAANPTAGGLVNTGPYAYIRHPIYAGAIYWCWAGALDPPGWIAAGFAALVTVGAFLRMYAEEQLLVERYPEYREYQARVRRIIPYVL